jgi:hypothetical protein
MDFRTAFVSWRKGLTLDEHDSIKLDDIVSRCNQHPRRWKVLEHIVLHAYERGTGAKVEGLPDWRKIFEWVKNNKLTILKLLLQIAPFFFMI